MSDNEWTRPENHPPPMFMGKKERDLVKQVNDEMIECVMGQTVLYYPISLEHSNFHPLYGECMEKTFLPPIRVYAIVEWEGSETTSENGVIDRRSSITVHFHKRRLQEDQEIFTQEGDFIRYGNQYYEIVTLGEPRELFGQVASKIEISAKCIKARDGIFNAE